MNIEKGGSCVSSISRQHCQDKNHVTGIAKFGKILQHGRMTRSYPIATFYSQPDIRTHALQGAPEAHRTRRGEAL